MRRRYIAHSLFRTQLNIWCSFFTKIVNAWKSLALHKMLNRLSIAFLNASLSNTVQKTCKRHLLSHIKHFVSIFLSCIFSFVEQIRNNVLQNEIKDLTFKVSNLSITFFFKIISYEGPNIYDIHTKRRQEIFCRFYCL